LDPVAQRRLEQELRFFRVAPRFAKGVRANGRLWDPNRARRENIDQLNRLDLLVIAGDFPYRPEHILQNFDTECLLIGRLSAVRMKSQ
jgi:hypothetical protein